MTEKRSYRPLPQEIELQATLEREGGNAKRLLLESFHLRAKELPELSFWFDFGTANRRLEKITAVLVPTLAESVGGVPSLYLVEEGMFWMHDVVGSVVPHPTINDMITAPSWNTKETLEDEAYLEHAGAALTAIRDTAMFSPESYIEYVRRLRDSRCPFPTRG